MKTRLAALAAICIISPISVNAMQQVPFAGYCGTEEEHATVAGEGMEVIALEAPNQNGVAPVMIRGPKGVAVGVMKDGGICVLWFHLYEGLQG